MKKRVLALMLAGMMAMTACGSADKAADQTEETTETTETTETADEGTAESTLEYDADTTTDGLPIVEDTVEDLGIDAFMTAGNYIGVEVSDADVTATEEAIDSQVASNLSYYPLVYTDADKTVEDGDTVNLDYSGSIDGVVFEGGTAEAYDLVIGSGSFIDDFEEQLIGLHIGDESEVEVTFPEEYHSEDLAGKDAVFAVKINTISRVLTEVTDEWLEENADGVSEAEYRNSVKEELEKSNLAVYSMNNFCMSVDFIQFPKDRIDHCFEMLVGYYDSYAAMYGYTFEQFLESMGATVEDIKGEAENIVRYWLVYDYVCEKEGITEESDMYKKHLDTCLAMYGVPTLEALLEGGYGTEFDVEYTVKQMCVEEIINDNAVIVPAEATAEETAEEE